MSEESEKQGEKTAEGTEALKSMTHEQKMEFGLDQVKLEAEAHNTLLQEVARRDSMLQNGPWKLDVHIQGARNLRKADTFGKSDPYAVVSLNGKRLGQTQVIKKTLDPEWDEKLEFKIPIGK